MPEPAPVTITVRPSNRPGTSAAAGDIVVPLDAGPDDPAGRPPSVPTLGVPEGTDKRSHHPVGVKPAGVAPGARGPLAGGPFGPGGPLTSEKRWRGHQTATERSEDGR
ncbi:hypothetical protein CELD12_05230 [Cellulomonas sp. NTE-D12]|nr:hypothetical protein CELD12_05230 [Cellulomonas sp. NTE-D12]